MSKVVINEVTIGNGNEFDNNYRVDCKYNDKTFNVHASRYISSFTSVGGNVFSHSFEDWLRSLEINDDDIYTITRLATTGKMELEESAREFLQNSK